MSDDWGEAWSTPAPVQAQTEWTSHTSQTFTNSNRSRGRGRGGGRGRGNWRDQPRGNQRSEENNARGGAPRNQTWGSDDGGGGWGDNNTRNKSWGNEGGGGGWGEDSRGYREQRNDKCEVYKIPSRMVGRVIGRGGSKISELQMRSSAKINVTKETDGDDTLVKIFGDDSTIGRAKELIDEVTEERPRASNQASSQAARQADRWDSYVKTDVQEEPEQKTDISNWSKFLQECEDKAAAAWNKLPPIIKNFYQEHPDVTAMSDEAVALFREESNNIVVNRTLENSEKPIPKPVTTFEQAFFNYPEILDEIYKQRFEKPSPIQSQAWPVLMSGEDLIGIAQTGTGKTLAFLLPAFIHIEGQTIPREERNGPTVLVMAPTRELALQIDKEVKKYQYRGITSVCVYGGGDRKQQVAAVAKGVDIVIATPGRMNDLNAAGQLNVETVTYVVLDEADRMLDMGFEPQIRKVMYSLRPTRQSIMTSATWPPGVRRLADSYMDDPVQVYVGSLDLAATHTVTQVVQIIDENEKFDMFMDFIRRMDPEDKVIVFCGKKAVADHLSVECALQGIQCASLHGDRDQSDREQAVQDIGDGTVRILIATDVASRGLDINDVTHVLNYDFPRNIEEYVHRVGRTGRAGKTGESVSFLTRSDWDQAAELIKILEEAQQYIPEEVYSMAERFQAMKEKKGDDWRGGRRGRGGGGGRRW